MTVNLIKTIYEMRQAEQQLRPVFEAAKLIYDDVNTKYSTIRKNLERGTISLIQEYVLVFRDVYYKRKQYTQYHIPEIEWNDKVFEDWQMWARDIARVEDVTSTRFFPVDGFSFFRIYTTTFTGEEVDVTIAIPDKYLDKNGLSLMYQDANRVYDDLYKLSHPE